MNWILYIKTFMLFILSSDDGILSCMEKRYRFHAGCRMCAWPNNKRYNRGNPQEMLMFSRNDLCLLHNLKSEEYIVLVENGHDVHLYSRMTGHEWIVISPYGGSVCEILHRHSVRYPFHHQRGKYASLVLAFDYIRKHDTWYNNKTERRTASLSTKR